MELEAVEGNLQFKVRLPKLADLRVEGSQHFLCTLSGVQGLSLQPFRNESTEIKDLKQIGRLKLRIEKGEIGPGGLVKVYCGHLAGGGDARLSFFAARLAVWDTAFDAVSTADLMLLRGRAAGK